MGNPKCTKEAIEQAVELKRGGMSNKDIAACIGVHERTFCKWLNEPKTESQRRLGQAIRACEAEYKHALRKKIEKAADADWRAAAWTLSHRYPEEYAENRILKQQPGGDSGSVPTFVYERR